MGEGLQFEKVEFEAPEAARSCAVCSKAIANAYFEAGGRIVCESCSEQVRHPPRSGFLRALLYGGGAALGGSAVWYAIIKITDMEIGLIAVVVGYVVGAAVRKGSGGGGGWKYQALAMFLTYSSITSSYIPFLVKGMVDSAKTPETTEATAPATATAPAPGAASPPLAPEALPGAVAATPAPTSDLPLPLGFALALAMLWGLALAVPFLGGIGVMGALIMLIALYEAWKLNRRMTISGPFSVAPAVA